MPFSVSLPAPSCIYVHTACWSELRRLRSSRGLRYVLASLNELAKLGGFGQRSNVFGFAVKQTDELCTDKQIRRYTRGS